MSGEIVNLNKARKARAKASDGATAKANRVKHGRSGAERARDVKAAEKAAHHLDHHKIEPTGDR